MPFKNRDQFFLEIGLRAGWNLWGIVFRNEVTNKGIQKTPMCPWFVIIPTWKEKFIDFNPREIPKT